MLMKRVGLFMKQALATALKLIILVISILAFVSCDICWAADKKTLIAYFSHTGNTREIANQIHAQVGGDILEIKALNPYPSSYKECTEYAKREQENDARPPLATEIESLESYDVVFIGYPIWWGTIPMPLFTLLEKYDFSGKEIIPFCTHGSSGLGRSVGDITKLCPQSTIREGLAVRGSSAKSAQNEVSEWLRKIGVEK
jgi:flavodoxin